MMTFKAGDHVQYVAFSKAGDTGFVQAVFPRSHIVGGVRARVRVKWNGSGHVGTVDDRVLVKLKVRPPGDPKKDT